MVKKVEEYRSPVVRLFEYIADRAEKLHSEYSLMSKIKAVAKTMEHSSIDEIKYKGLFSSFYIRMDPNRKRTMRCPWME